MRSGPAAAMHAAGHEPPPPPPARRRLRCVRRRATMSALASSSVTGADIDRMVGRLFLAERRQRSAFWVLLVLAAVIAGAGVVSDSDPTVIGAMIVAPL